MGVEENKKRLAEAMDELADRHILEAMNYNLIQKKRGNAMKRQLATAACILLVVGLVGLIRLTPSMEEHSARTGDSQSFEVKHTSTESTESEESEESSQSQENGPIVLPSVGENERLVVQNGENLTVLDKYGNTCSQFEHATIYFKSEGPLFKFMGNMLLVSLENPLPIQVETGAEEYKVGLYSLEEDDWLIEPTYEYLNLLSNTVFTTSELLRTGGNLMKTDGSVIWENVGHCSVTGDYIMTMYSMEDNQNSDDVEGQTSARNIGLIFDLEGNYLSSYDAINYIYAAYHDKIIMKNGKTGEIYLQDGYGNVAWTVPEEQWKFCNRCGDYLSWCTTDEEATGIITDWQLNEVMNDEKFFQLNADLVHSGRQLKIFAWEDSDAFSWEEGNIFSWEEGDSLIVSIINEAGITEYYRCDSNFEVLDTYDFDPASVPITSAYLDEITYSWAENAAKKFQWTEDESNTYIEDLQEKVSFTLEK